MKRLLVLLVLCIGCGEVNESPTKRIDPLSTASDIRYVIDSSTGLCFAFYNGTPQSNPAFVCIPCDSLKRIKTITK